MTAPPKRVGPYEILGFLGEGGMGTVYRARDPRLDRVVALKVLRADAAGDADRQARFILEAKSVSSLNHPNIVTVHDVGSDGGVTYMVMEFVEGQPLDQLITAQGMRVSDVLRVASQIADAFADAHARKIVHRDLKPANVMVQPNGRVKVLDFGLAKLIEDAAPAQSMVTQTAASIIVGTAAYMSPEQAEGKPLDARSDIFSFGALLYEMCTGKRAFQGDSNASVLADVLREEPKPLRDVRADVPAELNRLITRCLRKDPARRVQSMADLKVAFDELREEIDSGKSTATAAAPSATVGRSRWSWSSALAGGAVSAAIVAAVFLLAPGRSTSPRPDDVPSTPLPLTTYPGREIFPVLSVDGNSVAFAWNGERQDNYDIYQQLVGAGSPLRLTTDPADDMNPAWSPDARFIAFIRRIDRTRIAVLTVPALGGAARRLAELNVRLAFNNPITDLVWTPAGKYLLVSGGVRPEDAGDLQRINVASGDITTIQKAPPGKEGWSPLALSPDGRRLAAFLFPLSVGGSAQVFRLTPDFQIDGEPALAPIPTDVTTAAWTPDGHELVYRISLNVPMPLYRVPVAGGTPTPMPWVGADASWPTFSAAKRRMVFARNVRDTNIWRLSLDSVDGGKPAVDQVAGSSFREVFPQFSPDGKRLVFYSNRGGSVQIWTANADGSEAAQLTSMLPTATTGSPRWSPDGRRVVFDSDAGGHNAIYETSADGGQPRLLTVDPSNTFAASYAPDGSTIYFSSNRSGRIEVWRQPLSGGDAQQVTRNGGNSPVLSPDGQWVYFAKDDGRQGLWRIPSAGGDEQRVTPDAMFRYNYVVTPSAVYYTTNPPPGEAAVIKRIDMLTRKVRDLFTMDKPPDLGLALSPDGRYLLFTQLDYSGSDLMLVENFR